ATSQMEFVSESLKRPSARPDARASVTFFAGRTGDPLGSGVPSLTGDIPDSFGSGPLNFRGCEAIGRYAEAVRVAGSQRTTIGSPSISSRVKPFLASAAIG